MTYILSYAQRLEDFKQKLSQLTEAQKGYIAGILDGEGSIGLYQDSRRATNSILTRVCLLVNRNQEIIDYIAKITGLKIYNGKTGEWSIVINHRAFAKVFLEVIEPYLIGKKERAKFAMEFISLREGRFHHDYTERELELVGLSKKGNFIMGKAIKK